jgi:acyl carrier protein phosphodiesterase
MQKENWLYNYRTIEGISRSVRGLVRRATYISDSETALYLFKENYSLLQQCYNQFFPDVKNFAKAEMNKLLKAE